MLLCKLLCNPYLLLFNRNASSITLSKLRELSSDFSKNDPTPSAMIKNEMSASLELLLKFQRLLVAFILPLSTGKPKASAPNTGEYYAPQVSFLFSVPCLQSYLSLTFIWVLFVGSRKVIWQFEDPNCLSWTCGQLVVVMCTAGA